MKKLASLIAGIFTIIAAFWFLSSPEPNATPKAKIRETVSLTAGYRKALNDLCNSGALKAGLDEARLGVDKVAATKYVAAVDLKTEDNQAVLTISLNDIYSDWRFWSTLKVEKGKTVVFSGQCSNKTMLWKVSGTTPRRYLPELPAES